ncbi:hypothetical protein PV326_002207 [Microctonus aethiopoides]|nr:hypothetical protein PV326_002207 [Microctonus aethiopoides]
MTNNPANTHEATGLDFVCNTKVISSGKPPSLFESSYEGRVLIDNSISFCYGNMMMRTGAECLPFPGLNETKPSTPGTRIHHECRQYDCASNGSWHILGCAPSTCVNQIGYVDYDYSKPYPECCPHPICG